MDFRGVTDVQVSTEVIQRLASLKSILNIESKHVIIAPAGLIDKLARVYQDLTTESRPNLIIVRTPEEAYESIRLAI